MRPLHVAALAAALPMLLFQPARAQSGPGEGFENQPTNRSGARVRGFVQSVTESRAMVVRDADGRTHHIDIQRAQFRGGSRQGRRGNRNDSGSGNNTAQVLPGTRVEVQGVEMMNGIFVARQVRIMAPPSQASTSPYGQQVAGNRADTNGLDTDETGDNDGGVMNSLPPVTGRAGSAGNGGGTDQPGLTAFTGRIMAMDRDRTRAWVQAESGDRVVRLQGARVVRNGDTIGRQALRKGMRIMVQAEPRGDQWAAAHVEVLK